MSDPDPEQEQNQNTIRRILIALDASTTSLAALQAATELAALLEAELLGLFVEDVNLIRLANLPFARVIGFSSASARPIDQRQMTRALRAEANRARRALIAATEQTEVQASFRVVQGQVAVELLTAAQDADLLILGRVSRPLTRRSRLGSTARRIVLQAPRPVLLAAGSLQAGGSVVVVHDGSALGRRAVKLAALIAGSQTPLAVVFLAEEAETAARLTKETVRWLEQTDTDAVYRRVEQADIDSLTDLAREVDCGLLVLPGNSEKLSEATVDQLLDATDCSVLLIRPPSKRPEATSHNQQMLP